MAASIRPTVAIVGMGAAGALVAIAVCETARRRRRPLHLLLIDPAPELGRGTAYATKDPAHLLNVAVGGMSCHPDDPSHFQRWLRQHGNPDVSPDDFVSRHRYGSYLADTLSRALAAATGMVRARPIQAMVTRCEWLGVGTAHLRLSDSRTVTADSVVLATGPSPGGGWIPEQARGVSRFLRRPWSPDTLERMPEGDVLLVGSGLTAVDLTMSLARHGRTVHSVSRSGMLPKPHAITSLPPAPPPATLKSGLGLDQLRQLVRRHLIASVRAHGDWRPAMDGLRPLTAGLWGGMSERDRALALKQDMSRWNVHRHRMPPATAEAVARALASQRLKLHTGRLVSLRPAKGDQVRAELTGGRELTVSWVVDCTGPGSQTDPGAGPLWTSLLADGLATPGPLGMGVATVDGRLRDTYGRTTRALFTLGAPRKGELWETVAIPEIRVQAAELAAVLVPGVEASQPRRPKDSFGLPLSTRAAAAAAYRKGLNKVLTVRAGAVESFARATELDPGFALGYAALALLGHECGADVDVRQELAAAQRCVRERGDARERSFVATVTARICGDGGAHELIDHLGTYPGDALALSVAVPTIAFSGIGDLDDERASQLLRATAPAYHGHWFHTSLLAFLQQEQGRHAEAEELARDALAAEPASGHAVHALAHVHYERGVHREGRDWLDDWLAQHGRGVQQRAHYSWHAALHDLALDDAAAVRQRWLTQLCPSRISAARALVDSGSLLWRARIARTWDAGATPVSEVLDAAPRHLAEQPPTAFAALHSAIVFTAAGDGPALRRLAVHAANADTVQREIIVPLCDALQAVLDQRWDAAAALLRGILPVLRRVGGSAAQREVVEETLLYVLTAAGRCDDARRLLQARLDRRPSPLDRRRLADLPV